MVQFPEPPRAPALADRSAIGCAGGCVGNVQETRDAITMKSFGMSIGRYKEYRYACVMIRDSRGSRCERVNGARGARMVGIRKFDLADQLRTRQPIPRERRLTQTLASSASTA